MWPKSTKEMHEMNGRNEGDGEKNSRPQPVHESASLLDVDEDFLPENGPLADRGSAGPDSPKSDSPALLSGSLRDGFPRLQDFGPKPSQRQHPAADCRQAVKPGILLQHGCDQHIESPALLDRINQLSDYRHEVADASPFHDILQLAGAWP